MNNTEKKLDALINALGFDVEEVVTTVHPPFSIMKACFTDRYNQQGPVHTVNYKLTKRDEPLDDEHKTHVWMGNYAISMDEYERDYGYMGQIKGLVKRSGIPKSVIIDLIQGMPNE